LEKSYKRIFERNSQVRDRLRLSAMTAAPSPDRMSAHWIVSS